MLQVDPYQLRMLAMKMASAANEIRSKAARMEGISAVVTGGAAGWKGQGAESFVLRTEFLAGEVRNAVRDFETVSSTLQTLAMRVEMIQGKKQELQRLQQQRGNLHWGLNASMDAEIAYLDSRMLILEGEITTESAYADLAAAGAFELIRFRESFQPEWERLQVLAQAAAVKLENTVIPAIEATWQDIKEHPDKYLKKAGELLLDGVLEFLSIPEMEEAWHQLTDPNSDWKDRLFAAGKLVFYGAVDISMFFGIGEEVKGAELAFKLGAKGAELAAKLGVTDVVKSQAIKFLSLLGETFGPELREMQRASQAAFEMVKANASRFFLEVGDGVRSFSRLCRGLPGDFAYAGGVAVRDGESVGKVLFSYASKSKEKIVTFFDEVKDKVDKVKSEIQTLEKGSTEIQDVEYGDQYMMQGNRKVLKPNVRYTTDEGYVYTTDNKGRISTVEGKLQLGKGARNKYAQKVAGREDKQPTDDGGHLIASIFKGSGDLDNLVPMDANLNRGAYKSLENIWKKALDEGKEVEVKVSPVFEGDSLRPDKFIVEYKINGKLIDEVKFKNKPGG